MTKIISHVILEKGIKQELLKANVVLSKDKMNDIKSLILFHSVKEMNSIKHSEPVESFEQIYPFIYHNINYELSIKKENEQQPYEFTLSHEKEKISWKFTPCYTVAGLNIDAKMSDTNPVFNAIYEFICNKSLYSPTQYNSNGERIAKEILRIKEAVYSATSFLDAVINDLVYLESDNVTLVNGYYTIVRYPFTIDGLKGKITFEVVKDNEVGCVYFTFEYEGFECKVLNGIVPNI